MSDECARKFAAQQTASGIGRRSCWRRCGSVGEAGRKKPAHADRAEPLRTLASSGSGVAARRGQQRREPSHCNAHPARAGGGVVEGQLRASNTTSNRRAPGLQRRKAPRSSRARFPSRGSARGGISVGSLRVRGVSSLLPISEPMTMGCSGSFGGGEPLTTSSCGVRM